MSDTRTKIVAAAMEIVTTQQRPSVRAVAARAGVGASTLRHYFPSQSELMDAVVQQMMDTTYRPLRIDDPSVPAPVRLRECLDSLLAPIGHGEQARESFWALAQAMFVPGRPAESGVAMARINDSIRSTVQGWLQILVEEGHAPAGTGRRETLLLLTVVDGVALSRALPSGGLTQDEESDVLEDVVAAVLSERPASSPATGPRGPATES